ncbi:MAG TPA: hypothetical protein P5081_09725 [Phycisphaerae bacterium]|nr:hypothetical protein [Phycisphaerae bacterium]HRW53155.1 hypothetical protein [Phycisphaerae bacterium]
MMTSLLASAIWIACAGGIDVGWNNEVPAILLDAFHRRDEFKAARFRYVVDREFPGTLAPTRKRYEARISGDDIAWTNFGDDDGVVLEVPATGEALVGVVNACAYRQTIRSRSAGVSWERVEGRGGAARGQVEGGDPMLTDPRSVGLIANDPRDRSPKTLRDTLLSSGDRWQWRVTSSDRFKIVTERSTAESETDGRRTEVTWRIDPERDNAIVEIEEAIVGPNGHRELLASAKTDFQFVDNRWWPGRFEVHAPKTGFRVKVTFESVAFDAPEHPTELTPDIWNMPTGAVILSRFDPHTGETDLAEVRYMGGGETMSNDDWRAMDTSSFYPELRAYLEFQRNIGLNRFPKWWEREAEDFGLSGVSINPDLWEAYVRRWIVKHSDIQVSHSGMTKSKLKPEQIAAAWAILEDSRRHAAPILRRMTDATATPLDADARGGTSTTGEDTTQTRANQDGVGGAAGDAKTVVRKVDTNSADDADATATAPAPSDASTLAHHAEPSWNPPNERPDSTKLAAQLTRHQRELDRVFDKLKRRLSTVLEREQRRPEDLPAANQAKPDDAAPEKDSE